MNLKIGQKVVCIDDFFAPEVARLFTALPIENKTYVVRAMHEGNNLDDGVPRKCTALLLVGLVNPSPARPGGKERGFNANRFRPLDEIKDEARGVALVDCYVPRSPVFVVNK